MREVEGRRVFEVLEVVGAVAGRGDVIDVVRRQGRGELLNEPEEGGEGELFTVDQGEGLERRRPGEIGEGRVDEPDAGAAYDLDGANSPIPSGGVDEAPSCMVLRWGRDVSLLIPCHVGVFRLRVSRKRGDTPDMSSACTPRPTPSDGGKGCFMAQGCTSSF